MALGFDKKTLKLLEEVGFDKFKYVVVLNR